MSKKLDINLVDILGLQHVIKIEKDMVDAVLNLDKRELRYITTMYYQVQDYRIATASQIREMTKRDSPHQFIDFTFTQFKTIEKQIERAMLVYTPSTPVGRWLLSIMGIGPVLAANFIAHLDITKTETAGGFWRFAGLDPTMEWNKKELRPWNAKLKVTCWKAGESWVKLSGRDDSFYSKIYKDRKALEISRNENGDFADQAKEMLEKKNFKKATDARKCYEAGKLPPAHIQARSTRYAVKLFLAHLHEVMYREHYGKMPPKPYIIEHGGHAHKIEVPNYPL